VRVRLQLSAKSRLNRRLTLIIVYALDGEIFATLSGLKPCTLLAHYRMPEYATGLVEKALKPMFDEFQLEKEGFELWKLKPPLTELFKGGWMFVNKVSTTSFFVEDIFLYLMRLETRTIFTCETNFYDHLFICQ